MGDEIIPHPVFDRIRELYQLPSDAAMARMLKIYPQDVPRQRKSGNIPYKQILSECPPEDWPYIFKGSVAPQGPAAGGTDPILAQAIKTAIDAGYDVIPRRREPPGEAEPSP